MDVHWWRGLFSQNMGLEVCLYMGAIMLYRLCIVSGQLDVGGINVHFSQLF